MVFRNLFWQLSLLFFAPSAVINAQSDASLLQVYNEMTVELDPSDYTIHDPSRIITIDGKQMIAVTGKAQEDGYNCGLETWWRETGSNSWQPGQCLFQTKPTWVAEETDNDGAYWAPELDLDETTGQLTLLYSVSEFDSDEPNTCVGIARPLNGVSGFPDNMEWEDQGTPMTCIIGEDYEVERSAIDPSVFRGIGEDENKLYLVTGGGYIIGTELDPNTYNQINDNWFETENNDWTELARGPGDNNDFGWVEAAYILANEDNGYYYLFVNWGACCNGIDSTYEIRVGRSQNPMGPYVDKRGRNMMDGGGSLFLRSGTGNQDYLIGPGHLGTWKNPQGKTILSFHYYDGNRDGNSWIAEKRLRWKNGWPKAKKRVLTAFPGED